MYHDCFESTGTFRVDYFNLNQSKINQSKINTSSFGSPLKLFFAFSSMYCFPIQWKLFMCFKKKINTSIIFMMKVYKGDRTLQSPSCRIYNPVKTSTKCTHIGTKFNIGLSESKDLFIDSQIKN